MPAPTREEAVQDAIDFLLDDLGATDFAVLFAPVPTQNAPYLVSLEAPSAGGHIALYVAQIKSSGIALPGGGAEFTSTIEAGPVLLAEDAVAGTLTLGTPNGEILTAPNAYLTDEGYEDRYPLEFETVAGIQQVSLFVNGGFREGIETPLDFDDRDVVIATADVAGPQGSNQDDVVELAEGANFNGFKGDDTILFDHGATVYGGSGEDIIQSFGKDDGDDVLFGNQNDDRIFSGRGNDIVDGGTGNDYIVMQGTGTGSGGKGNDELVAKYAEGPVSLYGGQGEDYLRGSDEADTLSGGDGADILVAGGINKPEVEAGDHLFGGKGNDLIHGSAYGDSVLGGSGKDFINGYGGDDDVKGGGSNDDIFGGRGDDLMYGGDGNDTLQGGQGADVLYGGNGKDIIGTEDDNTGGRNNVAGDFAYGGSGNDTLMGGRTADALYGGRGRDDLSGDRGDDTLDGGSGDDQLDGGLGNDTLNSGDGEDTVMGGSGDDFIRGGHDDDELSGGQGADIFGFGEDGSTDVVTDFEIGRDSLQLVNFEGNLTFDDLFLSQDDSAAVIQAGDTTIRLENTDVDDLDEASFLL